MHNSLDVLDTHIYVQGATVPSLLPVSMRNIHHLDGCKVLKNRPNKCEVPAVLRKVEKKWTKKEVWSVTSSDKWWLTNGYRHHSGRRQNILFHILSAGEVPFLVRSTVQCSNKLNHKIALRYNLLGFPTRIM